MLRSRWWWMRSVWYFYTQSTRRFFWMLFSRVWEIQQWKNIYQHSCMFRSSLFSSCIFWHPTIKRNALICIRIKSTFNFFPIFWIILLVKKISIRLRSFTKFLCELLVLEISVYRGLYVSISSPSLPHNPNPPWSQVPIPSSWINLGKVAALVGLWTSSLSIRTPAL